MVGESSSILSISLCLDINGSFLYEGDLDMHAHVYTPSHLTSLTPLFCFHLSKKLHESACKQFRVLQNFSLRWSDPSSSWTGPIQASLSWLRIWHWAARSVHEHMTTTLLVQGIVYMYMYSQLFSTFECQHVCNDSVTSLNQCISTASVFLEPCCPFKDTSCKVLWLLKSLMGMLCMSWMNYCHIPSPEAPTVPPVAPRDLI